jgi:hypothetical protein
MTIRRTLGIGLAVLAVYFVASQLPDIVHYIRIRNM